MFLDFVSALPIGVGHVPWPSGRSTFVAKLCLRFTSSGALELDRVPPALSLDLPGPGGELAHPSDFAPYKPRCDVAIVGPAVFDRAAPGYLVVGSLTRRASANESLGARAAIGAAGNPLAAEALASWRSDDADFARFQAAPAERQMVPPTSAFAVQYARGTAVLSGRFEGPFLRAFVATGDPARMVGRVPLSLDTVLVDPAAGTLVVLFRGVYERNYAPAHAERLVLDVGPGAPPDPAVFSRWPARHLAAPTSPEPPRNVRPVQGRMSPLAPQETSVLVLPVASAALPFSRPAFEFDEEETHTADAPASPGWEDDTTAAGARAPGPTLPFQRAGVSAAPRTPALDLAALRAAGARPVADAWGADETLMGRTLQASQATSQPSGPPATPVAIPHAMSGPPNMPIPAPGVAPLGGAPRSAGPAGSVAPAPLLVFPRATQLEALPPAPAPLPAPQAPSPPVSTAASTNPDDAARVQAIMQEVWKGQRPLAEILAAHGLTEAQWRALRRTAGRQP